MDVPWRHASGTQMGCEGCGLWRHAMGLTSPLCGQQRYVTSSCVSAASAGCWCFPRGVVVHVKHSDPWPAQSRLSVSGNCHHRHHNHHHQNQHDYSPRQRQARGPSAWPYTPGLLPGPSLLPLCFTLSLWGSEHCTPPRPVSDQESLDIFSSPPAWCRWHLKCTHCPHLSGPKPSPHTH